MLLRKSLLPHMQAMSATLQPATFVPLMYLVTQSFCTSINRQCRFLYRQRSDQVEAAPTAQLGMPSRLWAATRLAASAITRAGFMMPELGADELEGDEGRPGKWATFGSLVNVSRMQRVKWTRSQLP